MNKTEHKHLIRILLFLGFIGIAVWLIVMYVSPKYENYEYDEKRRMTRNKGIKMY